jgi:hypothetical protein
MSRTVFLKRIRNENNRGKKPSASQQFACGGSVAWRDVLCAISETGTAANGHDTGIGK